MNRKIRSVLLVLVVFAFGFTTVAQAQTTTPNPVHTAVVKPTPRVTLETGVIYWLSTINYREDFGPPTKLVSRLTFTKMSSQSIELFAWLDVGRVFLKGSIGLGGVSSGQMFDEDWDLYYYLPYLETRHQIRNGITGTATVDVGITVLKRQDKRVGVFLGYNRFAQRTDQYGCVQLAPLGNQFFCSGGTFSPETLASTVDTVWNSVRVGIVAQGKLAKRFKVNGELALLGSKFNTRDNHLHRTATTYFDSYGYGYGLQAEIMATYVITDRLSVNGGWRYWAMATAYGGGNCTSGASSGCMIGSERWVTSVEGGPDKFSVRRSGIIVGLTGKF